MTEYQLTPDEQGMVNALMAEAAALNAQVSAVLGAIVKFRCLGSGDWAYDAGRLVKRGSDR